MAIRKGPWRVPARNFLRMCRRNMRRPKVADTTGVELTGGGLLTGALVFRRLLVRHVLEHDDRYVGVLVPPSVGGVLANAALLLDRRVPVNLSYAVPPETINACIARAGIRRVLASRKLIERLGNPQIHAELVLLEDLRAKVTLADKLTAATQAWALPVTLLERRLGLHRIDPEEVMTVIFTSGSTGEPKGAMLTHRNVGTNVEAFDDALNLGRDDVLMGVLPFFHSFGFTVAIWAALVLDPKVVYHYNPLEAREVGRLSRQHGMTILVATPTFLRSYVRRCAGGFRQAEPGGHRRREAAQGAGRRLRAAVRRAAAGGIRDHRAFAGRLVQHPGRPQPRRPLSRQAGDGGPAAPRHPGQGG